MRGGMGLAREIEVVGQRASFSSRGDNFKTSPKGANGGGDGGRARVILKPKNGPQRIIDVKQRRLMMAPGDRVRMETPGGGGFGEAHSRSPDHLAADIADDRLSCDAAEIYPTPLVLDAKRRSALLKSP